MITPIEPRLSTQGMLLALHDPLLGGHLTLHNTEGLVGLAVSDSDYPDKPSAIALTQADREALIATLIDLRDVPDRFPGGAG